MPEKTIKAVVDKFITAFVDALTNAMDQTVDTLIDEPAGDEVIEQTEQSASEKDDTGYPDENNRDAWLVMCEARGITVPPRTRTATLVSMVKEFDEKAESVRNEETSGEIIEKDPFGVEGAEETPDPFAEKTPPEEPVTLEKVFAALQQVQAERGTPAVIELLKDVAGVAKVAEIPEDQYEAVYKAAVSK